MEKLVQYSTLASAYDKPFGNGHPWIAAGMGYALFSEGSVLAVDGGHAEDAESFAAVLLAGREKVEVDTWIITHPHPDHYGALLGIARDEKLRSRVSVKRIVSYFRADMYDDDGRLTAALAAREEIFALTGAESVTPSEEKPLRAGGFDAEFLFVPTSFEQITDLNGLSLVFTLRGKGKKVMITGDADRSAMAYVLAHHKDKLKSDVLQLAHHGLCDTGDVCFYRAVGAECVLIPTCRSGYEMMKSGFYGEGTAANDCAEDAASEVFRSFEGNCEILL